MEKPSSLPQNGTTTAGAGVAGAAGAAFLAGHAPCAVLFLSTMVTAGVAPVAAQASLYGGLALLIAAGACGVAFAVRRKRDVVTLAVGAFSAATIGFGGVMLWEATRHGVSLEQLETAKFLSEHSSQGVVEFLKNCLSPS